MQAESGQTLKCGSDGNHQLIWLASRHLSTGLPLDDQLPQLAKKARTMLADQLGDGARCPFGAEQLVEQLKEFEVIAPVLDQPRDQLGQAFSWRQRGFGRGRCGRQGSLLQGVCDKLVNELLRRELNL